MTQEPEQLEQLPDAIVERLRARDRQLAMLTPRVDRQISAAATAQFAPRQTRSTARRWYAPVAAAAAAALVALLVASPWTEPPVDNGRLADDVDGSGRVDVLDVFALARTASQNPSAVGEDRIAALGRRIVSLGTEESVL